jgi:ATP-binding cassette subfamily B protein
MASPRCAVSCPISGGGASALKARVVIALLLVLAAKAATLTMPFAYKAAIDRMTPGQEPR